MVQILTLGGIFIAIDELEYIIADDAITRNTEVNSVEYSAYIATLMMMGGKPIASMFISPLFLCYAIMQQEPVISRKSINIMKQGIKGLQKKTHLNIQKTSHDNVYLINSGDFFSFDKYGTKVMTANILTIMRSNKKSRKALLKYYVLLLSLLAGKKENCILAAKWTIEEIAKRSGLHKTTIVEYNKALAELELIYFYEEYIFDNEGKCQSTIFAKWENKHHVKRYVNHYFPFGTIRSKDDTNKKRSYAAMYRWFCKGKEYDEDTVLAIKEYVSTRNERIQTRLNNPNIPDDERQELGKKLLDETIFERL